MDGEGQRHMKDEAHRRPSSSPARSTALRKHGTIRSDHGLIRPATTRAAPLQLHLPQHQVGVARGGRSRRRRRRVLPLAPAPVHIPAAGHHSQHAARRLLLRPAVAAAARTPVRCRRLGAERGDARGGRRVSSVSFRGRTGRLRGGPRVH